MNEKEELLKVGTYNSKFNDILKLNIENMDSMIILRSEKVPDTL